MWTYRLWRDRLIGWVLGLDCNWYPLIWFTGGNHRLGYIQERAFVTRQGLVGLETLGEQLGLFVVWSVAVSLLIMSLTLHWKQVSKTNTALSSGNAHLSQNGQSLWMMAYSCLSDEKALSFWTDQWCIWLLRASGGCLRLIGNVFIQLFYCTG